MSDDRSTELSAEQYDQIMRGNGWLKMGPREIIGLLRNDLAMVHNAATNGFTLEQITDELRRVSGYLDRLDRRINPNSRRTIYTAGVKEVQHENDFASDAGPQTATAGLKG